MNAKELGRRNVVTIATDDSISEAAKLMRAEHVGDLVVVRQEDGVKYPVGMLTDRDITVATVAFGVSPEKVSVESVMSGPVVFATETEDYERVVSLMRERGIKRIPLVGQKGELTGIVCLEDVLMHLSHELAELSEIFAKEKQEEEKRRLKFA